MTSGVTYSIIKPQHLLVACTVITDSPKPREEQLPLILAFHACMRYLRRHHMRPSGPLTGLEPACKSVS